MNRDELTEYLRQFQEMVTEVRQKILITIKDELFLRPTRNWVLIKAIELPHSNVTVHELRWDTVLNKITMTAFPTTLRFEELSVEDLVSLQQMVYNDLITEKNKEK